MIKMRQSKNPRLHEAKKWLIDGTYRKIVTERYDKATRFSYLILTD